MKILPWLALALVACTADSDLADGENECFTCADKADGFGITEGSCAAKQLLAFASDAARNTLDDDVGLDARAAKGIANHARFETLADLDAVPYVGPVAFQRLIDYTRAHGLLICAPVTLVEGEPNTEFMETFVALQEEATDCIPGGRAFSYQSGAPTDRAVAQSVATQYSGIPAITTNVSRTTLASFLASFGFDLDGLHSAIGFDDYVLARARLAHDDVMILHYRARREVWTVSLRCD